MKPGPHPGALLRGGGRIWFDDELVREDGVFVVADLAGLNPDPLKG